MYPVLFQIGPFKIYMYGLMIAAGFLVVMYLMQRDARKRQLDANFIAEMGLWTLLWGIVGARLAHIIMYSEGYSWSNPLGWINVSAGGLVFQGAIPPALYYVYWGLKRRGIPFWSTADLVIPYVPLAQAFGRIGCIFYGCCYGRRADHLPWGLRFPAGSPAFTDHQHRFPDFPVGATSSFTVHPTQLYEAAGLLLLCALMLGLRRYRRPVEGFALPLYLAMYGIIRFVVECFRGDGNPTSLGFGLVSNQQVFCILMTLAGGALYLYLRRRGDTARRAQATPAA